MVETPVIQRNPEYQKNSHLSSLVNLIIRYDSPSKMANIICPLDFSFNSPTKIDNWREPWDFGDCPIFSEHVQVPNRLFFAKRSICACARDAYISTPAEAAVAAAVGRKVFVHQLSSVLEGFKMNINWYWLW